MAKGLVTIASFLLFVCSPASAQVDIGIQTGADFPMITNALRGYSGAGGSFSKNSQTITRFYGGFLADIPLGKRQEFIIRPSLLYLGAGGETPAVTDYNGNALALQTKYDFEYVQLPLQLLFSPKLPFGRPWIGGGFYGSTLVSAAAKTSAGPEDVRIGNGQGDDLKRFDFGFIASAGLTLKCGILVGVDFQQSLTTIIPDPPAGQPAVRNSIWGVHIGYISSIGGGYRSGHY